MADNFFRINRGLSLNPQAGPSDPAGINGDIYYNTALEKFRKFQNGAWTDLALADLSDVVGVLAIANGGTDNGALAVTAGGVLYTDGTKVQNAGAGTAGQVLTFIGGVPVWQTPSGGSAPIGGILDAMLNETQFQTQMGTSWILADGRTVGGSGYETILGGSSLTMLNPAGTTTTGATLTFFHSEFGSFTANTHGTDIIDNISNITNYTNGLYVLASGVPSGTTTLGASVTFTVTTANATAGAIYTSNTGAQFNVTTTLVAGTTLVTTYILSASFPSSSGTLSLFSGTGDPTITYSAFTAAITMSAPSGTSLTGIEAVFATQIATTTGNTTIGLNTITNLGTTTGLVNGLYITSTGSTIPPFSTITAVTLATVPDLRGMGLRGANNGGSLAGTRADGDQDPAGNFATGTYEADEFQGHEHSITDQSHGHNILRGANLAGNTYALNDVDNVLASPGMTYIPGAGDIPVFIQHSFTGITTTNDPTTDGINGAPRIGPETRVKAVIINHFIRIN
jgi:hypothetical protein